MTITKTLIGENDRVRIALDSDAGRPVLIITDKESGEETRIFPTKRGMDALVSICAPF